MNRGDMRTLLRRQLQDPSASTPQWTDGELDSLIDSAYFLIQTRVFAYDRNAHLSWDTLDTVADQSAYELPSTFGIRRVGLKASASATVYDRLKPKTYDDILESTSTTKAYSKMGQFLMIFPAPETAITNGIQLLHTPIMAMNQDADIPKIKEPLHIGIVWMARIIATDEDESTDLNEVKEKLRILLDSIPTWYSVDSDENPRMQPVGI